MAAIDIDGGVPSTTLNGAITSGATSITVADGSSYPDGTNGNFYIVIDLGAGSEETIECSGRSSNTLTVATRGADGSSATSHDNGATVQHVVPALTLQEANTHANQTTGTPHGSAYVVPSGNVATATALETGRTIVLSGDVSGTSGSFDGTANATITTTIADNSHNHTDSTITGTLSNDTTGNAATATTATNLSGGTVNATTLTASQDANFNSGTLFVDVSTNRVGIGDTTPGYKLDVAGEIRATNNIRGSQFLIGTTDDGIKTVTGDYGTVQTAGSGAGGYEGYSIAGHAVFMSSSSSSQYGLYDDANSKWGISCDRLGGTKLYYNGTQKLVTASDGATVTGTLTANAFSGTLDGDDLTTGTVAAAQIDTAIARKSGVYAFEDNTGYNITASTGSGTPSSTGRGDGDIHIYYTT